jgi:heat shock protein HslJ
MAEHALLGNWDAELPGRRAAGLRQPELGFEPDGRLHGCAGVNRLMGSYTVDDGVLACGPVALTMMAGPPEAMAYEQAFLAVLAGPLEVVATPDGLDLAAEGEPVLRLTRPAAC